MNFPDRPTPDPSRKVLLMATCLCDTFYADVARATVEVLDHLGVGVEFPEAQTCCGQPAFNAGDWKQSRSVVRHGLEVFAGDQPVVVPSGSCAAMWRHGASLAFEKEKDADAVRALASRTWEICDFIVNGLGVSTWEGRFEGRVALHRSCHTRGTNSGPAAAQLLRSIEGLELLEFDESEQCCGFGGTFAVSFPETSKAMGERKLNAVIASGPECVASTDMGCMLHLNGMAANLGKDWRGLHVVQILRDSLRQPPAHP